MEKCLKGPWKWFVNIKTKQSYLATCHSGRQYVLGFKRWGMNSAKPVVQNEESLLVDIDSLGEPDHNGDIQIDHPVLNLIALAPDMMEILQEMLSDNFCHCEKHVDRIRKIVDAFKGSKYNV